MATEKYSPRSPKALNRRGSDLGLANLEHRDVGRDFLLEEAQLLWENGTINNSQFQTFLDTIPSLIESYGELDRARKIMVERLKSRTGPALDDMPASERVTLLKRLFADVDDDQDGLISSQDLRTSYVKATGEQPREAQLRKLMESADENRDGLLSWEEFLLVFANEEFTARKDLMGDIRRAFDEVDQNKDSAIDFAELKEVMTLMNGAEMDDAEVQALFAEVDVNRDGFISFDEFILSTYGWYSGKLVDETFAAEIAEKREEAERLAAEVARNQGGDGEEAFRAAVDGGEIDVMDEGERAALGQVADE